MKKSKKNLAAKVGLDTKIVNESVAFLKILLADVHILYVKTLHCHWNMVDPRFYMFHKLLDDQYNDLQEDGDLLAERIRMLGQHAPASLKEFIALATISELIRTPSANEMIRNLVDSYEHIINNMRKAIDETTEMKDFGTADLLTEMMRNFDKRAWLLRSHLE